MTDIDNDDFNDDTAGDGNAAKALRKQNTKLAADLKAREDELAKFRAKERTSTIADALKANGGKESWAKYVALDIEGDVTPEAVRRWLEVEAAGSFDWTPPEADELDEAETANRAGARRVAEATRNAPAGESAITPDKMRTATHDQLKAWGVIK